MAINIAWASPLVHDILNFQALPSTYSTLELEAIKRHVPNMHLTNT